ncbi:MAG: rod shape-determining protein [Chromatiaceae bacterium]|nr:rod shape-determining protein [Chromatiaceae bacterium]
MTVRRLLHKCGTTIYVRIWENRINFTDIQTRKSFDEKPLVAIDTKEKLKSEIVAVGNAALSNLAEGIEIINPFSHPRVLFTDFVVGEKLFQYALKKLLGNKLFSPAPVMIIHPMEKIEGGLTMIEVRALKELAFGAGARDSVVYVGKELLPHEIDYDSIKEQMRER